MGRHDSLLGKRPTSMPLDDGAAARILTPRGLLRSSAAAVIDDESMSSGPVASGLLELVPANP